MKKRPKPDEYYDLQAVHGASREEGLNLSIIIPCYFLDESLWNTTVDCIEQVEKQLPAGGEIVLMDDGSPYDVSGKSIPCSNPNIFRSLKSTKNGGYAAAVNAAVGRWAKPLFVVLNNDAYVQPGCLPRLHAALKDNPMQIVTAMNVHPIHGEDRVTPCGACWGTSLTVFNRLGRLDTSFGVGAFEDTDFWFKARAAGIPIVMDPEAKIATLGGATIKRHPGHASAYERNKAEIILRWGSEHFKI